MYGFETNTGVKFVVVVDMRGRRLKGVEDVGMGELKAGKGRGVGGTAGAGAAGAAGMVGLREGEMKVVCVSWVIYAIAIGFLEGGLGLGD